MDPTGHSPVCEDTGDPSCGPEMSVQEAWKAAGDTFGITFGGTWSAKETADVMMAVNKVGNKFASARDFGESSAEAWKAIFGNSFTFKRVGANDCTSKKGKAAFACTGHNKISVSQFYGADIQNIRLMMHEIGHAFDLAVCSRAENCTWYNQKGGAAYDSLGGKLETCETTTVDGSSCLGRFSDGPISGPDQHWGFAGGWDSWQFGAYEKDQTWEVFADMFVGWVSDTWAPTDRGTNRSTFMNNTMSGYLKSWTP